MSVQTSALRGIPSTLTSSQGILVHVRSRGRGKYNTKQIQNGSKPTNAKTFDHYKVASCGWPASEVTGAFQSNRCKGRRNMLWMQVACSPSVQFDQEVWWKNIQWLQFPPRGGDEMCSRLVMKCNKVHASCCLCCSRINGCGWMAWLASAHGT